MRFKNIYSIDERDFGLPRQPNIEVMAAFGTLLFFVIGDILTTWYGLNVLQGGLELNFMARAMGITAGVSIWWMLFLKLAILLVMYVVLIASLRNRDVRLVFFSFLAGAGYMLTLNNLFQFVLLEAI